MLETFYSNISTFFYFLKTEDNTPITYEEATTTEDNLMSTQKKENSEPDRSRLFKIILLLWRVAFFPFLGYLWHCSY